MNTFPNQSALVDPVSGLDIPSSDLAYVKTRNRLDAFNVVSDEFRRSRLSKKELARRLKMDPGRLTKLLGAPGNWTLDTAAILLWAMSGARIVYTRDYPLAKPRRNDTKPPFAEHTSTFTTKSDTTTKATIAERKLEPVSA